MTRRFLPWIWWTLLVLLLSGAILIIGEPARSLGNPAFVLKMCMLATVLILTLTLQKGITREERFWESSPRRGFSARVLAASSLVLWSGIVFAGINMVSFHWIVRRDRSLWLEAHITPWPGRLAGLIALLLWIGIVAFGRWIGFEHVR